MDDVITLISETVTGYDSYGNEIRQTASREVMCKIFSVSRNEFYSAATAGLKPEIIARLSEYADYENEKIASFHDEMYDIIRVYRGDNLPLGSIELTLQKKVSNG